MLKESELKKMLKNFNKYGKGLRPDGIYAIDKNELFSQIKNQIHGTPGTFKVVFNDDKMNEIFFAMCRYSLINGVALNKVLSGTGLKITLDSSEIIESIESKDEIWVDQPNTKIKDSLISSYYKYNNMIENNIKYEFEFPEEFIEELKKEKNFIIDISQIFELPEELKVLKISNKVLKNFSKTTTSIKMQVSYPYNELSIVKYIVYDDITKTESIYAVLI